MVRLLSLHVLLLDIRISWIALEAIIIRIALPLELFCFPQRFGNYHGIYSIFMCSVIPNFSVYIILNTIARHLCCDV